jgi:hypothetical protein
MISLPVLAIILAFVVLILALIAGGFILIGGSQTKQRLFRTALATLPPVVGPS